MESFYTCGCNFVECSKALILMVTGYEVPEADCRQRDETVVECVLSNGTKFEVFYKQLAFFNQLNILVIN